MTLQRPRIVIVGGGFAGLQAAMGLASAPAEVVVVDRRNHHLFQPLLYQVATAGLSPAQIATPIRESLWRQRNATVRMAEVTGIDAGARTLATSQGPIPYDYLVLAAGATHSYFGHDAWAASAPGLKSIEDAVEIRRRFLMAYERAEQETDPVRQRAYLTFVIIGAGPTGVEMAGAVAWLLWAGVHIMYLIGFRNRVSVMFEWAWAYVFFHRGARLITEPAAGGKPGV